MPDRQEPRGGQAGRASRNAAHRNVVAVFLSSACELEAERPGTVCA